MAALRAQARGRGRGSHLVWAAVVVLLAAMFITRTDPAGAHHEPANKVVAAGSDLDEIGGNDRVLLLSETMRVSTTIDLMLHVSAECSILTSLNTAGGPNEESESDFAFGQVKVYIEIDGKRVPVSTDDTVADSSDPGEDRGRVVFCNRAYQRTVTDREENENLLTGNQNGDGIDEEDDFIRTRTANAFTWIALDAGDDFLGGPDRGYDNPSFPAGTGNNIVQVDVYAEYDRQTSGTPANSSTPQCPAVQPDNSSTPLGQTCAEAFVGSRTLIIDADIASVHERVDRVTNVGG